MFHHLEPYLETANKFAHLQDFTKFAQFVSKRTPVILMRSISMSDQINLRALSALSMRGVSGGRSWSLRDWSWRKWRGSLGSGVHTAADTQVEENNSHQSRLFGIWGTVRRQ